MAEEDKLNQTPNVEEYLKTAPKGQMQTQNAFKEKVANPVKEKASALGEKIKQGTERFKSALGNAQKAANEPKKYNDPYYNKPSVTYRTPTQTTDKEEKSNQDLLKDRLNETEDLIQRGATEGEKANKALQNVEIPRSKLASFGDILKSDEFKGQRVPYFANAVGTALANSLSGLSGREYDSYLKQHNQAMADTYAQNKAARDKAAVDTNIQDIEAGNKAEMGKYVQMSDAMTDAALKRYGLLEDTESKRQMLESIVGDATGKYGVKWGDLDADEKIAVMSLMQAYNGDYSMMSLAMEKYGDKVFDFLDRLFNKVGEKLGVNVGGAEEEEEIPGEEGEDITLFDGTIVPRKEYQSNKDSYVTIPQANGEPVIVKKSSWNIGQEGTASIVNALMNSSLSDADKIKYAYMIDNWVSPEKAGLNGNMFKPTVTALQGALTDKGKNDKIIEQIDSNYGKLDALKSLKKTVEKANNQDLLAYYNNAVGIATVKKDMGDWKNNNSLSTEDKINLLDKLETGEYADLIAKDPSLQKSIAMERQGYEIRQKYNDPLLNDTNSQVVKDTIDKKGNAWQVTSNGNVAKVKKNKNDKFDTVKEYDLSSANFVKDTDNSTVMKLMEDLALNSYRATLEKYQANADHTLSPKEVKELFKQSSEYTAMTKLLNNAALYDKVSLYDKGSGKLVNPDLSAKYYILQSIYNVWN